MIKNGFKDPLGCFTSWMNMICFENENFWAFKVFYLWIKSD